MRYYEFIEPTSRSDSGIVFVRRSETEILGEYQTYWRHQLANIGKNPNDYTKQDCIDDWIVVHWAYEVFPDLERQVFSEVFDELEGRKRIEREHRQQIADKLETKHDPISR